MPDRVLAICFESELTRVTSQLLSTAEGYTSVETQRSSAESRNLHTMRITAEDFNSVLDLSYVASPGDQHSWPRLQFCKRENDR